ncbi:hypothetical protein L4D77_29305 [Photobacterium frigidiphilum]|uniref:hypothetical protein n=1 Tax=Photobacterium frigidiphilum TaxID=264736 RepID=UPI003D108AD3
MKLNLTSIKSIYKSLPPVLVRFLEYIPFKVFCGKEYVSQCSLIENEQVSIGSDEHIKRLLDFSNDVINNVPFYQRFCRDNDIKVLESLDDFRMLPLINKEMILNDTELFVDHRYKNNAYKVSTGGTTGRQLSFLMSNSAYSKEWAFVNSYIRQLGGDENSRRLCLRGVSGIKENNLIGYNPLYKEMLISPFHLTEDKLKHEIDTILAYKPKWIHGYPSSVALLSKLLKKMNMTLPSVEFVLLVSEKLYDEQYEVISETFGPRIHSFYGMTERVIFAPLKDSGFVPDPLYCFVEEIDEELIGTGFINDAFPILRYRTGDSATTVKTSNNVVKRMPSILGRWGREYLIGNSGIHISMTSLNVHCNTLDSIERYQFVQECVGKCFIDLLPGSDFTEGDEKKIKDVFQRKLGSELHITSRIVDDIQLTTRGKHKFIVNKIECNAQ